MSTHGTVCNRIDTKWQTHSAISRSSQCSTTGLKKAVCYSVCGTVQSEDPLQLITRSSLWKTAMASLPLLSMWSSYTILILLVTVNNDGVFCKIKHLFCPFLSLKREGTKVFSKNLRQEKQKNKYIHEKKIVKSILLELIKWVYSIPCKWRSIRKQGYCFETAKKLNTR